MSVRFPGHDAHRMVAPADAKPLDEIAHRLRCAKSPSQNDVTDVAIRATEKVLGPERLSRHRLKKFFETYPDATLVWLHRDPVQVVSSSAAMMRDIMEGIVGPIDMVEEVKQHLARTRASNQNTMTNPLIDDPRIHHVRYKDFVSDPVGTIAGYCGFGGRELTQQAEEATRTYLAGNQGDRHGKFEYSSQLLVDADIDVTALNEEFAPYRERFGVPIEKR